MMTNAEYIAMEKVTHAISTYLPKITVALQSIALTLDKLATDTNNNNNNNNNNNTNKE